MPATWTVKPAIIQWNLSGLRQPPLLWSLLLVTVALVPRPSSIRSACTEGLGTRLVLILFKTTCLKQPLVYNGQKILVPWVTITTDIRFEIIKVVTHVLMEDTKYL